MNENPYTAPSAATAPPIKPSILGGLFRVLAILGLLVSAVVCILGFYCNAWIAQAGNPGPRHADYLFTSRFYGVLAMVCLVLAIAVWFSGSGRSGKR
jgi:hypothetical protein